MVQKIAFITGNPINFEERRANGDEIKAPVLIDRQIQKRFEEFAKNHKIIDWHTTQQSHSSNWYIVVRFEE